MSPTVCTLLHLLFTTILTLPACGDQDDNGGGGTSDDDG